MSVFAKIFRPFKKNSTAVARNNSYERLFDFLIKEISVPKQAEELIAIGRKSNKPVDDLLSDYFLFERYLTNIDPEQKYTRESLRQAIQNLLPELRSDAFFSILFLPDKDKKQQLAISFVELCLHKAIDNFGHAGNGIFDQQLKELKQLQHSPATEESLQYIHSLSDTVYHHVATNFGGQLAEKFYNYAYQETARYYKELEVFPYLISILPRSIVGYSQLNLLTQTQIEQIFLEKLSETEKLNQQLSQKIKEAEEAQNLAMKNEVLLRSVIASSLDGMITLNDEGCITTWNPAAEEMFGYTQEEVIGNEMANLIIPPEHREAHKQGFSRFLQTHTSNIMNRRLELKAMRKDGSTFPAELTITAARHNNRYYFNGFIRDISERVQKESELLQTRLQAELAAKAKTDFLSVMSHEIRTPLHAIIGFSHLLLDNRPRPDQMEFLNMLKFSGETLLHIINDILDFNKLESGKLELDQEEFSLKELLDNIYKTFLPKSKEKGIELLLHYDANLPASIKADPGRLSQVLNNLVSNAIKFTHTGYVKIEVNLVDTEGHYLIADFAVTDTGIGIAYDKQQKIFDLFTQADSDTTRKYGGTGLGLSIAKKIVQLMGSEIKLQSHPWNGSKFYFRLKLQQAAGTVTVTPEPEPEEKKYNRQAFAGKKILLAEDNTINIMVAKQFVLDWGGDVDVAINGQEALELYLSNHYDLVLMDLQMPVMDGFTSTKEIRKHNSMVPVIALTASSINEVLNSIIDCGMNDYISKPFVPEMLYNKLCKYLLQEVV